MEPQTTTEPTAAETHLTALKLQYPGVQELLVKVSDTDTAIAYLKPADRNVVAVALSKTAKNQLLESGEFILANCYVEGDPRLKLVGGIADGPIQIAGALAAAGTIELLEATIKKL